MKALVPITLLVLSFSAAAERFCGLPLGTSDPKVKHFVSASQAGSGTFNFFWITDEAGGALIGKLNNNVQLACLEARKTGVSRLVVEDIYCQDNNPELPFCEQVETSTIDF